MVALISMVEEEDCCCELRKSAIPDRGIAEVVPRVDGAELPGFTQVGALVLFGFAQDEVRIGVKTIVASYPWRPNTHLRLHEYGAVGGGGVTASEELNGVSTRRA
jgi:hypothetical protein